MLKYKQELDAFLIWKILLKLIIQTENLKNIEIWYRPALTFLGKVKQMINLDKLPTDLKRLRELQQRYISLPPHKDPTFPYDEFNQLCKKLYPVDVTSQLIKIIEVMRGSLLYAEGQLTHAGYIKNAVPHIQQAIQEAEKIAGEI